MQTILTNLSILDQVRAKGYWVIATDIFDASQQEAHIKEIMSEQPAKDLSKIPFRARIAMARASMPTIEKNGLNDHHHYKYAKAEDIQTVVGKHLAEHGIIFGWRGPTSQDNRDTIVNPGPFALEWSVRGRENVCRATGEFGLLDAYSDTALWFPVFGEGADIGDKAFAKAHTAMRKAGYLEALALGVGEDSEEAEGSGDELRELSEPQARTTSAFPPASRAPSPEPKASAAPATPVKMTAEQLYELMGLIAETNSDVAKFLNHFKASDLEYVPYVQARAALIKKRDAMVTTVAPSEGGAPQP